MFKCCYCNRLFKTKADSCPGCGSNEIVYTNFHGTIKIATPPLGGYSSGKLKNNFHIDLELILSIFVLIVPIKIFIFDFEVIKKAIEMDSGIIIDLVIVTIVFLVIGLGNFMKFVKPNMDIHISNKKNQKLSKSGVLIKNIPINKDENIINNHIELEYTINDKVYRFKSRSEYGKSQLANVSTVDLLYDQDNPNNYYLDIEIY